MMGKKRGTSLRVLGGLFDLGVASGASDGQLLEHFAMGSAATAEAAFGALLERHGPMVLRVCRAISRDEHSAMDAFQATFLVLIRKSRSLWVRESLGPWLHRVARRAAGRVKSDALRRRRFELRAAELAPTQAAPPPVHRDELALVLHEEVDRLPERFRLAILLCDLEGRTCEEAARLLACPVGTLASRLARGRGRLRLRLTRRGLAPTVPALAIAFSRDTAGASVPASLRESTIRFALGYAATKTALGASCPAAVSIATAVSRSLFMTKISALAVLIAGTACVTVGAMSALRAFASSQSPQPLPDRPSAVHKQAEKQKTAPVAAPERDNDLWLPNELLKERNKNSLLGTIGNMRPVFRDEKGRWLFHSREALLYKDGTVKLFRTNVEAPVAPPLRHRSPIREVSFIEQFKLLITTSDDSVKIWDALSGELRKEIDGQAMRPLLFTSISSCAEPGPGPLQFATIDVSGRTVTTWDARTLEQVMVFRPEGTPRLLGACVTGDGKTLATIAMDRSVTLWSAGSSKPLATFYQPSPVAARCFADDVQLPKKPVLQLYGDFWKIVAPVLPAPAKGKT
jgi:RNA polymerase sigma factor (sigma-70 family)